MSDPTFIGFIDESGDEGERDGCSRNFVLSAAVFRKADERMAGQIVDDVRNAINNTRKPDHRLPQKEPLHFSKMSHDARRYFCAKIGASSCVLFSVVADKKFLGDLVPSVAKARLYRYTTGLLVTQIVHYCCASRADDDSGDGTVDLIFSNRSTMDYDELKEYMRHLTMFADAEDRELYTKAFRLNQVRTLAHQHHPGLQIADGVAGAMFHYWEPNGYGMRNSEYVAPMLRLYFDTKQDGGSHRIVAVPLTETDEEGLNHRLKDVSREESIFEILDKKKAGSGPKDPTGSDPAAAREPSPDDEEGDHR